MLRKVIFVLLGLTLTVGAACGSSPTAGGASPTPAQTSTPASPSGNPTPVSYDPCALMTPSEATVLTGISYSAGREDLANGVKDCVYGYQTTDVLIIGIVQAPDLATAQASAAEAEAALQKLGNNGLTVNHLQGFGDEAVEIQGALPTVHLSLSGIYVLKGTIFFFISDVALNRAAATNSSLENQATTILSRL